MAEEGKEEKLMAVLEEAGFNFEALKAEVSSFIIAILNYITTLSEIAFNSERDRSQFSLSVVQTKTKVTNIVQFLPKIVER